MWAQQLCWGNAYSWGKTGFTEAGAGRVAETLVVTTCSLWEEQLGLLLGLSGEAALR